MHAFLQDPALYQLQGKLPRAHRIATAVPRHLRARDVLSHATAAGTPDTSAATAQKTKAAAGAQNNKTGFFRPRPFQSPRKFPAVEDKKSGLKKPDRPRFFYTAGDEQVRIWTVRCSPAAQAVHQNPTELKAVVTRQRHKNSGDASLDQSGVRSDVSGDQSFIGIACAQGDAVVDTAAEDGCVGQSQLDQITRSLARHRLQWVWTQRPGGSAQGPSCTGIGGGAKWVGTIELPVGIAKLNGVLKLNVIQDSKDAPIPLLLPINLLEALGFDIKLKNNTCVLEEQPWPDGQPRVTSMTRLPSGHRCISIEV